VVGEHLPGAIGGALVDAADHAFTDALAIGVAAAAGLAVVTAVVVLRRLPGASSSVAGEPADRARASGAPAPLHRT
jgi:hypothetical protein